jgi:hypothetical protein
MSKLIKTELHTIRFAENSDFNGIIDFIRTDWNANHIFVHDIDFFKYEFCYDDSINFILAINNKTGQIDGLEGFIKYTKQLENSDIFAVLWKVRNNTGDPILGVRVLTALKDHLPVRAFLGIGLNPKTLPIYRYIGYTTEKLTQYYLLNDTLDDYKIAEIRYRPQIAIEKTKGGYDLVRIHTMDELKSVFKINLFKERIPFKDEWYLNRRYFNHPIYNYQIFGIQRQGGNVDSILVAREASANDSKVLRIVDFIGCDEDLACIGFPLHQLMVENRYEYIDFYQYGIDEEILINAGFSRRQDNDGNIIPNYFEPFVRKNVEISFFTTCNGKFHMFKGDGDQDRPSIPRQRKLAE